MFYGKHIRLIIILISLAVIGLVFVQIYWIRNAIELKSGEFKNDVNASLQKTVESLQRNEALGYIRNTSIGSKFFSDLYVDRNKAGINKQMSCRDTTVIRDGKPVTLQVLEKVSSDSTLGIRTQERMFSSIVRNGIDEETGEASIDLVFDDSIKLFFRPKSMNDQMQIGRKAEMVEEILSEMFEFRGFLPLEKRINLWELDSLLRACLHDKGITAEFEFVLVDIEHNVLLSQKNNDPAFTAPIIDEGYSINLFPGDFINEPVFLFVRFPSQKSYLLGRMLTVLSVSGILMLTIIFAFFITISTILKQKKLSEIKNDFISNMTHELKTPISTISLATEMLSDSDVSVSDERRKKYIRMISDENKRLGILVENVLQTAVIERGELRLKTELVPMVALLRDLVSNFTLQINKRGGKIQLNVPEEELLVNGDKVHLTNVVYNLLDNANKYSHEVVDIEVSLEKKQSQIVLRVADKGIGISKENQKRIFEHLYRVPSGNIHTVKGFGLGLSYVKAVVEKHGGSVTVESEIGKGSIFTIEIPVHL